MVVEHTRALVSYDDRKNSSHQNRDYEVAQQCANVLEQKGVDVEVKGYSDSALDKDPQWQWLILIHSSEVRPPSPMINVVNTALDHVVARRMRDVLAITTNSSDLRPEWASIRKYDVSSPGEEDVALRDMVRAMEYVKLPYNQALVQQRRGSGWNRPQKAPSVLQLAGLVTTIVVIMLIIAGGVIFLPGLLHPASTATSAATATAGAQSARATQTTAALQASPGVSAATQQAKQKDLNALTKASPTIQGFQAADKWSNPPATAASSCMLSANNAYTVNMNTPNQYNPCLATKPTFTNFVMQVTMKIQGDAGGVIFRSNSISKAYYRLALNQSDATTPKADTFSLIVCNKDCTANSVDSGTSLTDKTNTTVNVDRKQPITLTLIARTNTFDVFINKQFVASITDPTFTTPWAGQIGAYAASLGNDTTVTFSNLKVWSLDKQQTGHPAG